MALIDVLAGPSPTPGPSLGEQAGTSPVYWIIVGIVLIVVVVLLTRGPSGGGGSDW